MGPSRGYREEGCVQQVKGKGRAHTHPLGTGGEGSQSSEHRHQRVKQSPPGSVLQNGLTIR